MAPALEFDLPPEQAARLLRCPPIASRRQGRARSDPRHIVWHDTAAGALHRDARTVASQGGAWRMERLRGSRTSIWLPATPPEVLATAASAAGLPGLPPEPLIPIAAFTGRLRAVTLLYHDLPARLELVQGVLRGVAQDAPNCRLVLSGEPQAMAALALEIAGYATLSPPRASLASCALAVAHGELPPPRHLGAPILPPGMTVAAALQAVTGHLADVILHWAPLAGAGEDAEPVHQMRVGVRRLRSALATFRRATGDGAVRELSQALQDLARRLGAARDWDVFLQGTGAAIGTAFAGEKRVMALLAAARRRRAEAYAELNAYLVSPVWRDLSLRLALLPTARPWAQLDDPAHVERLAMTAETYGAAALRRSWKKLRAMGEGFEALPPVALHELRKDAKQLRYAAEFFAPLFPAKAARRFLARLADLQETLGAVNDGQVAAALMARLGGGERAFATGVVQGFVAAGSAPLAAGANRAWRKLRQQDCFWE